MSDTAAITAPEVSTGTEPVKETSQTVSDIKMGARHRLAEKFNQRVAQANEKSDTTTATDRLRQPSGTPEGGQFMKTTNEAMTQPENPVTEPTQALSNATTALSSAEAGATNTEQATTPVGTVTVPLADDHPLRQRGRKAFEVSKEDERDLRALLNSHTRRSELDQVRVQNEQLNTQLIESRANGDYWQERANSGGTLTAEQLQTYTDLKNTYGEADADNYRNGIIANAEAEGLSERVEQARNEHVGTIAAEKAQNFAMDAINDALQGNPSAKVPPQYPGWTEGHVRQALSGYGSICQARGETPTPAGWYRYANAVYQSTPEIQNRLSEQRNAEQARIAEEARTKAQEEARTAEEEKLQDAATRHSTRPRGIPSTISAGVRDTGSMDENQELRMKSPGQQRRARRSRVRSWGQQAQ